jgi:hypothetical protein
MVLPLLLAAAQQVAHFNGSTAAAIPDSPNLRLTRELTIEAWVRLDPAIQHRTFACIVSKNYAEKGYELTVLDRPNSRLHSTDTTVSHQFKPSLPVGKWVHVAYARSLTKAVLYVDGKKALEAPTGAALVASDLPLHIGSSNGLLDQERKPCAFIGDIREVQIWSVARSGRNIARSMHRRLSGREAKLEVLVRLNKPGQRFPNLTGKTGDLIFGSGEAAATWVAR